MVRTYVRKTERSHINEVAVKNAIYQVLRGTFSERVAARNFNINRNTLHSRIAQKSNRITPESVRPFPRPKVSKGKIIKHRDVENQEFTRTRLKRID